MGEPWASLIETHRERFADAVQKRTAYEQAERAIPASIERDRAAALDGKPGRTYEQTADGEAERAYVLALSATDAANAATLAIVQALRGEHGDQLKRLIDERINARLRSKAKHAEQMAADLADLAVLASTAEGVERTRKHDRGRLIPGRGHDVNSLPTMFVCGVDVAPALVTEALVAYDPRKGRTSQ